MASCYKYLILPSSWTPPKLDLLWYAWPSRSPSTLNASQRFLHLSPVNLSQGMQMHFERCDADSKCENESKVCIQLNRLCHLSLLQHKSGHIKTSTGSGRVCEMNAGTGRPMWTLVYRFPVSRKPETTPAETRESKTAEATLV